MREWLDELNETQKQIAMARGNICVIARAGTGKTRTLIASVIDRIRYDGLNPNRIVLSTFTNLAAREMRERIINHDCDPPYRMGTFHHICGMLMRKFPVLRGSYEDDYRVIDDDEADSLIRDYILPLLTYDDTTEIANIFGHSGNMPKISVMTKAFYEYVSAIKSEGIDPYTFNHMLDSSLPQWILDSFHAGGANIGHYLVRRFYDDYQKTLVRLGLMDLNDMVNIPWSVLKNNKDVLNHVCSGIDAVYIDEYQDSSTVQCELANLLASKGDLFTVGDDAQSIYRWRGAHVHFIRDRALQPGVQTFILNDNYRSSKTILAVANHVLGYDTSVTEVRINGRGRNADIKTLPVVHNFDSGYDEVANIATDIEKKINNGSDPRDIAVLCRSRYMVTMVSNALSKQHVPFMTNEFNIWKAKDIKYLVALMRLSVDINNASNAILLDALFDNDDMSYGIGKVKREKLFMAIAHKGFFQAMNDVAIKEPRVRQLLDMVQTASHYIDGEPQYLIEFLYRESGLEQKLADMYEEHRVALNMVRGMDYKHKSQLEDKLARYFRRSTLVNEFVEIIQGQTLHDIFSSAVIGSDSKVSENKDAVRILTIHGAKALEWDHVYISGVTQNHLKTRPIEQATEDSNEAVRLLYVAITRARKSLYIGASNSYHATMHEPCHIIEEIDKHMITRKGNRRYTNRYSDFDFP